MRLFKDVAAAAVDRIGKASPTWRKLCEVGATSWQLFAERESDAENWSGRIRQSL